MTTVQFVIYLLSTQTLLERALEPEPDFQEQKQRGLPWTGLPHYKDLILPTPNPVRTTRLDKTPIQSLHSRFFWDSSKLPPFAQNVAGMDNGQRK